MGKSANQQCQATTELRRAMVVGRRMWPLLVSRSTHRWCSTQNTASMTAPTAVSVYQQRKSHDSVGRRRARWWPVSWHFENCRPWNRAAAAPTRWQPATGRSKTASLEHQRAAELRKEEEVVQLLYSLSFFQQKGSQISCNASNMILRIMKIFLYHLLAWSGHCSRCGLGWAQ